MADENKNTENLNAAATPYPTPGSEADIQEWESAKNAGLRGIDAYLQRRGFDPQEEASWDRDMLYWAASHDFLEVVKHLIEKCKFDPTKPNFNGYTVLLAAAEGGSLPIVQYLVEKYGAHIFKAKTEQPCTMTPDAADSAARNGHLSVVKYLCEKHGFNPRSILLMAVTDGHLPIVQYLVEKYGPAVLRSTRYSSRGHLPMHLAAAKGHLHLVRYLSLFAFNFRETVEGYTALGFAIRDGHTEIVRFLIEEMGCDLAKEDVPIQHLLKFAEEERFVGRPVDETHVTFCSRENLQNLYQSHLQKQVLLTAIAADEEIGAFPDELLSVIAAYATPGHAIISEASAAGVDAVEESKLAPHEEIEAVLSTYSHFLEYVQTKIAHLSSPVLSPLLALLLDSDNLQDQINTAEFLGKVILNAPTLLSVDQLHHAIQVYLEKRKQEKQDTAFLKALHAISAHLETSRQTAALAKIIFDRMLRLEEEATAPCERTGRTRAELAANVADSIARKYDDLCRLVQHDPKILQFPVSADSTLGEHIASHLEHILKTLKENMVLELKKPRAAPYLLKEKYRDEVTFFIEGSSLSQREKDRLYAYAHDKIDNQHLAEKFFSPLLQNRPLRSSTHPCPPPNLSLSLHRQAILVANLFAEAHKEETAWKYLHAYHLIKTDPAILEQPVSEGKTLGQAIAPYLVNFLTVLDQHTVGTLELGQEAQQIQHTYFRHLILLIETSGLDQEKKNALYVWCAHSRTVNHAPPTTGFFRAAPAADANQFWREMFLAQRKEVEEKNEVYCAGS